MKKFGLEKKQVSHFRGAREAAATELQEEVNKYIKCLEAYPEKKAVMVIEPDWIQKTFPEDLKRLKFKMKQYPEMAEQLRLPLSVHVTKSILPTFFRNKLLLRDEESYSENPPLTRLLSITEELCLPPGLIVNPKAKQVGVYFLSREDQEILDQARTLFAKGIFKIGTVNVELKVELDLLMAQPGYIEACKELFYTAIIKPNIVASQAALDKHMPDLIQTYLQCMD